MKWKPVIGYETSYEVAEDGTVRGLARTVRPWRPIKLAAHTMQASPDAWGYPRVHLNNGVNGIAHLVHQLVARAFIGERPKGYEINHIDGNKQHNHWSNLEYVTPKQNQRHSSKLGLIAHGERSARAKLTNAIVKQLRVAAANGVPILPLAKRYGVNNSTAYRAIQQHTWKHIAT